MNLKKLLLLASAAIAVAAAAVPATTFAEWRDEGLPIPNNVTLEAEGVFEASTFIGGLHCDDMTVELVLEAGTTTGRIEEFTAEHECHGTGNLEGCQVAATEATDEPVLHQSNFDIRLTDTTLWAELEQTIGASVECGVIEVEFDFHGDEYITVEVDSRNAIGNLTLRSPNGGILTAFGLEVPSVNIHAELTIEEPNHRTYGF